MCGLAGLWQGSGAGSFGPEIVRRMSGTLRHRGPDDHGFWSDPGDSRVSLGHTRLAVIDVSPDGHQPMVSTSGRYVVMLNGEIYSYQRLREALQRSGVRFRGRSDTEVAVATVERWGLRGALERFTGMFALAVLDVESQELHLVRDRLGEKPLYYGWVGGDFVFASELKALRRHPNWSGEIDPSALALYFRHNYLPAPYCIYEGISKLAAGTMVSLDCRTGACLIPQTYWSPLEVTPAEPYSDGQDAAEAERRFVAILRDSVRDQMTSDVPLGAFLSGGIDSSLIVSLMQESASRPVRTFTIGFEEGLFDEAPYAKEVARHLGTDHSELYVRSIDARDVIPDLPTIYDEPFADPSQLPTTLLCRLAAEHVTVCLSGDGGDELFAGYPRYTSGRRAWKAFQSVPYPLRGPVGRAIRSLPEGLAARLIDSMRVAPGGHRLTADRVRKLGRLLEYSNPSDMYRALMSYWDNPADLVPGATDYATALSDPAGDSSSGFLHWMMMADLRTYLPDDLMVKVDRAAMNVSLEVRAPFLDHRVVEMAIRFPTRLKTRDGEAKWLLKQILRRRVPPRLVDRPKMGFGVPVAAWLRGPLREWADNLLGADALEAGALLNPGPIQRRWREHIDGTRNWEYSLWGILMFQAWRVAA